MKILNIPVMVYTDMFCITGFVKVRLKSKLLKRFYPRRISDLLAFAGERMAEVGEKDFIELSKADIRDLKNNELIKAGVRRVAINKNSVKLILPLEVKPVEEER